MLYLSCLCGQRIDMPKQQEKDVQCWIYAISRLNYMSINLTKN